jgi:hypothetical protein
MRQITSISQNPSDGALFAMGFQAPTFPDTQTFGDSDSIFTLPRWSVIPPSSTWSVTNPATVNTITVNCPGLALPISATFVTSSGDGGVADLDDDGDVDLEDLADLEACRSGPAVEQTDPLCDPADLDGDGDVDQDDFSIFQRCYSGANIPPDPDCAD